MTLSAFFYNLAVVFTIICAVVVIVVQPYKKEYDNFNILDTVVVLVLALGLASTTCLNTAIMKYRFYDESLFVLVVLIALIPLVYLCMVTVHWIYSRGFLGF